MFHQLDVRYEALRPRDAKKERQVLASLAEVGQLLPVVVVGAGQADRYVLLDGHNARSGASRSPIPEHPDPPFRSIPITSAG